MMTAATTERMVKMTIPWSCAIYDAELLTIGTRISDKIPAGPWMAITLQGSFSPKSCSAKEAVAANTPAMMPNDIASKKERVNGEAEIITRPARPPMVQLFILALPNMNHVKTTDAAAPHAAAVETFNTPLNQAEGSASNRGALIIRVNSPHAAHMHRNPRDAKAGL